MKRILLSCLLTLTVWTAKAQLGVRYDASSQATRNLQYFRPKGNLFVGDCMPFSHDGTYYYYWLLDSAHHKSLGGLGGHQWALSTTKDLKSWKQYPLVLGIDETWEKSICTGSIVYYKKQFYAFYATRLIDENGKVNEQLSYAISPDGIHFDKQKPNPFYTSAPGYSKRDFRDPKVFVDEKTGEFHLFVSSSQENPVMKHAGGALVHLTSKDLKTWKVLDPVLTGQKSVPECPDYFYWKGWYYLLYSDDSDTHYVKSRGPYGPWQEPKSQAFLEQWVNVVKTASFGSDRRIAAGWIPSRRDDKDSNGEVFGGNSVFREVIQLPDGTLETKFPEEMIPETGSDLALKIKPDLLALSLDAHSLEIDAANGYGAAHLEGIPKRCRITMEIEPVGANEEFGFVFRSDEKADKGYRASFSANNRVVSLSNTEIQAVSGLDKTIKIDIILNDDIIDICIDNKRCIVNRLIEQKGELLWLFAKHGKVRYKSIQVLPLL